MQKNEHFLRLSAVYVSTYVTNLCIRTFQKFGLVGLILMKSPTRSKY